MFGAQMQEWALTTILSLISSILGGVILFSLKSLYKKVKLLLIRNECMYQALTNLNGDYRDFASAFRSQYDITLKRMEMENDISNP